MNIIAVGPREQDLEHTNGFFAGSVTLYGSGRGSNVSYCAQNHIRINHNIPSQSQTDFINNELRSRIREDPDVRFMSYDPNQAYDCDEEIVARTVCLNLKSLMERLNHKMSFRRWAERICSVHHSDVLSGAECSFQSLLDRYGMCKAFVVQADFSCGGEGTWIVTEKNYRSVERELDLGSRYLVSPYVENNVPVNVHAIIYEKEILLFPPSIQIMSIHANKLLYHGADFIGIQQANATALEAFCDSVLALCRELQAEGYRGVIGVDGMLIGTRAVVLETNNRFQGSTSLINRALHDAGLPSMQELNYEAFEKKRPAIDLENFAVPYSCYTYIADEMGRRAAWHDRPFLDDPDVVGVRDDGLQNEMELAPMASLERVIFRTNIVSVTSQGEVVLHPNIPDMDSVWMERIIRDRDILYTKIALLNQGVRLSQQARSYLDQHGGMREGVYNAVDITFCGIVINSAVRVKFAGLSPFSLETGKDGLVLCCCGQPLGPAQVQPADTLQSAALSPRVAMKDICLLATDRVRVQHARNCWFKSRGVGCRFCEVEDREFDFTRQDVFSAIDRYLESDYVFRHFLIGGRSDAPEEEAQKILEIAGYIHSKGDWPIYVMCVPPRDLEVLARWKDAGVTEIAMNMEIWDQDLARAWMPGKGAIPRKRYLEALERASELWGKTGAVRSAFVVGLEPEGSLLEGVEAVCATGAAPILSVFRPIPGTEGEWVMPPQNAFLLSVYQKAASICKRYGLALGPTCVPCQNNTLSLPC